MNLSQVLQYSQTGLAILGGLYVIVSAVGNTIPNTKVGQFCRKIAADLVKAETVVADASKQLGAVESSVDKGLLK